MKVCFNAKLLNVVRDRDVLVTMSYERDDPFALHATFALAGTTTVQHWEFSRELLMPGLVLGGHILCAGPSDVTVSRLDDKRLLIGLNSPNGSATLEFPLGTVSEFLGRTLVEVPLGTEQLPEKDLLIESLTGDFGADDVAA